MSNHSEIIVLTNGQTHK